MNRNTMCLCALAWTVWMSGCGGPKDKSLLLKDWESVCVAIDPATLLAMNNAVQEKGVGNVKSSDVNLVFKHMDSEFKDESGPGVIVYSGVDSVPSGAMFVEMRVWQCYEAVLADDEASGIHVNPGAPGMNPYTVSAAELRGALEQLPRQPALPFNISVKQ